MMMCVQMGWPSLLIGPPASGKTSLIRLLAQLTGNRLHEFAMTSSMDYTELLGCF
jgi:ABC-type polar amino acid transport system ATPase subunit